MPFPRHIVEPRYICRGLPPKPEGVRPMLEEYSNLTLTNIIRQLATLCGQVNSVFGRLISESDDLAQRLKDLKLRLETIEEKTNDLNSVKEKVGGGFGKDRKAVYKKIVDRQNFFQAEQRLDTGVFVQETQPTEVQEMRTNAEAMPRLHELDQHREDGKECAKIYSNPDLFFLAWQDSLQQMIAEQHAKSNMRAKRTVRQTKLRRVRKAKASRIIEAQKLKMGRELATTDGETLEEDEYYSDEDWSSSDDDVMITNGETRKSLRNGLQPKPNNLHLQNVKHKRLSSFREYDFNDIDDLPQPSEDIEPHSPPISVHSLKLNGDLPPPPPLLDFDYSGRSAEYDVQGGLESLSIAKWSEDE